MRKFLQIFFILLILLSNLNAFPKTVLVEIFTSTTCPPCATQNPYFDNWLNSYQNKERVAVVKYHTWWPSPGNDPFYHANTTQNQARVSYYSTNYVPRGIINGNLDGQSSASSWIVYVQNTINNSSPFDIRILGDVNAVQGGNITVKVTADHNIPSGNFVLHFVVVESKIFYTGTNGDPIHNFVMRRMYPDHNGEAFAINPGETKTFSRVFQWNSTWNLENSSVVAFIQNTSTKEVYQASIRKANVFLANPLPIFPPNNSLNQSINITLKWSKIQGATNYGLEVARDSSFSNLVVVDTTLIDTFKNVTKLLRETRYYWRVKAISPYYVSEWSDIYNFKTLPNNAPQSVQLIFPQNQHIFISPDSIVFNWLQSYPDVDMYRIEIAGNSDFSNLLVDSLLPDTVFRLNQIINAISYYWRVTAHNGVGWGSPSEVRTFSVLFSSVADEQVPDRFELYQNYPNPFNPVTKIFFTIPENYPGSKKITLKVYDLLGNEICTLIDEIPKWTSYEIEFNAEKFNLSSGVYLYQLRYGEIVSSRKMVYLR